MDPVTAIFYAVICGGLALFAPSFPGTLYRTAAGAAVGFAAAALLPLLRGALGI